MKEIYGVGVVGLGAMGQRMLNGFQEHSRFEVLAVYDNSPSASNKLMVKNIDTLIHHPDIACIYIATPPKTHAHLVTSIVQANKMVFCEKPLTVSLQEAKTLANLSTEKNFRGAVNFNYASARSALRLLELVQNGRLGTDLSATLTVRLKAWPREWQEGAMSWLAQPEQGGFTREIISHFVFLALRLFGSGKLHSHSVIKGAAGTETSVRAEVSFENALLTIDAGLGGEESDHNRFEVIGSKASANISDWYTLTSSFGNVTPERPDQGQLDELAKLLDGQPSRLATFAEAASVVKLIEEILE
jgi:predicted dehydrogenase